MGVGGGRFLDTGLWLEQSIYIQIYNFIFSYICVTINAASLLIIMSLQSLNLCLRVV